MKAGDPIMVPSSLRMRNMGTAIVLGERDRSTMLGGTVSLSVWRYAASTMKAVLEIR